MHFKVVGILCTWYSKVLNIAEPWIFSLWIMNHKPLSLHPASLPQGSCDLNHHKIFQTRPGYMNPSLLGKNCVETLTYIFISLCFVCKIVIVLMFDCIWLSISLCFSFQRWCKPEDRCLKEKELHTSSNIFFWRFAPINAYLNTAEIYCLIWNL